MESSLIGLTNEEVDDRLTRLVSLAKHPHGEKVVNRYMRLVMNTAGNGLKTEIQDRLKGEAGIALHTKGISYMVDSLPVAGFFKERKETANHTGITRAIKQLQKRLIGLVSTANANETTLKESLAPEVAYLKTHEGTEAESLAQEAFINAMLKKVTEYDGWASNLEYTTRETASSYITEFGELCCIGRCALEYGMLRDAGFRENDIFSADVEGHSTLIVRLKSGELKMLENSGYIDDDDTRITHPYFRVYELRDFEGIQGVNEKNSVSLSTQTIRSSNEDEFAGFKKKVW